MRIIEGNLGYEIVAVWTGQHTRYQYTIYKLGPQVEEILVGEKVSFHEAEADARKYMKMAFSAWARRAG